MIFPVDVIKSAIMTDSIVPAERKYKGMINTAQVGFGYVRFLAGLVKVMMFLWGCQQASTDSLRHACFTAFRIADFADLPTQFRRL